MKNIIWGINASMMDIYEETKKMEISKNKLSITFRKKTKKDFNNLLLELYDILDDLNIRYSFEIYEKKKKITILKVN